MTSFKLACLTMLWAGAACSAPPIRTDDPLPEKELGPLAFDEEATRNRAARVAWPGELAERVGVNESVVPVPHRMVTALPQPTGKMDRDIEEFFGAGLEQWLMVFSAIDEGHEQIQERFEELYTIVRATSAGMPDRREAAELFREYICSLWIALVDLKGQAQQLHAWCQDKYLRETEAVLREHATAYLEQRHQAITDLDSYVSEMVSSLQDCADRVEGSYEHVDREEDYPIGAHEIPENLRDAPRDVGEYLEQVQQLAGKIRVAAEAVR